MSRLLRHALALALVVGALPRAARAQAAGPASAPSADQAAVRQALLDYVEGFYEGDSTRFVRSVHPDVYKYGYSRRRGPDSLSYTGMRMTWPEFHAFANRVKANNRQPPATAPKKVEVFDVLDQTAAGKVTAWWGTDYVLLAKYDGQWKIVEVLWQSPPPRR